MAIMQTLLAPPVFGSPVGVMILEFHGSVLYQKTRISRLCWLRDGSLVILAWYQHVMYRKRDRSVITVSCGNKVIVASKLEISQVLLSW